MAMSLWLGALVLTGAFSFGCAKEETESKSDPVAVTRRSELESLYQSKLLEALALRDPLTGWLTPTDCDGMLWTGKYAASRGVTGVSLVAAEYPNDPGKFARRPPPYCWDGGDNGSKSEWSRDMGVAGLFPWAFKTGDLTALERHADYGRANGWKMGEPTSDGRTYYTPQVKNLLFKVIEALGGSRAPSNPWPDVWSSGLTDYQAHVQVMSIWLHGETGGTTATMRKRLKEHAEREPENPLYRAAYGDLNEAADLLLDGHPTPSYVRCENPAQCQLSEWLFAASLVLGPT